VVIMMADESDACRDVVRYWQELKRGSTVFSAVGLLKGGTTIDYPFLKLILNRLANTFIGCCFA